MRRLKWVHGMALATGLGLTGLLLLTMRDDAGTCAAEEAAQTGGFSRSACGNPGPQARSRGIPLVFENVRSSRYTGSARAHGLEIAALDLRPRRLGFFNLHSLYELRAKGAHFEVHLPHREHEDLFGIHSMVSGLPGIPAQWVGSFEDTPLRIDGLMLRFFEDRRLILEVRARRAHNRRTGSTELRNAVLTREDGVFVRANRVIWLGDPPLFSAPDGYSLWNGRQSVTHPPSDFSLRLLPQKLGVSDKRATMNTSG